MFVYVTCFKIDHKSNGWLQHHRIICGHHTISPPSMFPSNSPNHKVKLQNQQHHTLYQVRPSCTTACYTRSKISWHRVSKHDTKESVRISVLGCTARDMIITAGLMEGQRVGGTDADPACPRPRCPFASLLTRTLVNGAHVAGRALG